MGACLVHIERAVGSWHQFVCMHIVRLGDAVSPS